MFSRVENLFFRFFLFSFRHEKVFAPSCRLDGRGVLVEMKQKDILSVYTIEYFFEEK